MSEGRCLDAGDLGGLDSWAEDDPRLLHLRDCARCQALLASYRLFTAAPEDLPPERLAEARARLRQARRTWPATPRALGREGGAPLERLRGWFGGPRYRAALAFGAFVVVVGAAYWGGSVFLGGREPVVLRGHGATPGGPSVPAVRLLAPRQVDGRLLLRWHAVPGADAYEVLLLDAGFAPLSRHATARDTALVLALPRAGAGGAAPAYWQVTARHSGDVLTESVPAPLRASPGW